MYLQYSTYEVLGHPHSYSHSIALESNLESRRARRINASTYMYRIAYGDLNIWKLNSGLEALFVGTSCAVI